MSGIDLGSGVRKMFLLGVGAVATTAGNAVAVPAVIAQADPSWAAWSDIATSQVAASAILTAILVPIITSWWAKKFGCPKFPKDEAQKALFEKG